MVYKTNDRIILPIQNKILPIHIVGVIYKSALYACLLVLSKQYQSYYPFITCAVSLEF